MPALHSADARQAALDVTGLLDSAPSATLERLTRLVRRLFGVPIALISFADHDRLFYAAADGMGDAYPGVRESPLDDSLCRTVVHDASPLAITDARLERAFCDRPGVIDGSVVAYLGVPLVTTDGHVLGSLCAVDCIAREWSADDIATMQDLAHAVMAEVNARAAANSHLASSEHYSDLLDTTTELVCSLDERGCVTYVNRAWCTTLGYSAAEAIGMPAMSVVAPHDEHHYHDIARQLRSHGTIEGVELVMLTREGRRVICRGRAMAVRSTDGKNRLLSSHAVYRDVTVEHRAEQQSRVLLQVTQALSETRDVSSALTTALRILGSEAGWEYAEAWLSTDPGGWSRENSRTMRLQLGPVWHVSGDARLVWFRHESSRVTFAPGEGLPGRVVETQRPVFLPDLANAVGFRRLDGALGAGLLAGFAVPIIVDGAVFAVFSFFSRDRTFVEREGQRLLEAVAAQVGTVLQRAIAEAQLQRERTFLSTVLDSLSDNVSVCGPDGRLVLFNKATRETHGLPESGDVAPEEWGRHYAVFHSDGVTPFTAAQMPLVRVLRTAQDVTGVEFTVAVPGRSPRTLVANAHVLRGPSGELAGAVCAARDMTAQKQAEAALRDSEQRLSLIYNSVSDFLLFAVVERDSDGAIVNYRCLSVNASLANAGLRDDDEFEGRTLEELASPANLELLRAHWNEASRTGEPRTFKISTRANDRVRYLESTLTPVVDWDGCCTHILSSTRDVTAGHEAEAARRESEGAFRKMLETIRAIAVILDAEGKVTFANESLLTLTGWTHAEAVGSDWFERFISDGSTLRRLFQGIMAGADTIPHHESRLLTRSGRQRLIVWDNTTLYDGHGRIVGTASIGHDVTEQRQMEKRLAELSERDELTGLLNRRGFMQQVEYAIKAGARGKRRDALLFIDLDKFKPINDTFGHAEGDNALRSVATLLKATIRDSDFAARIGGDEFAVYAVDAREEDGGVSLNDRLQAALVAHNRHATENGRPYEISFTVGRAHVLPGDTRDSVLARADEALYALKRVR